MAASPILRAIPEAGRQWDDPSEDLLFILLGDIEAGEGSFLIVERTTDPRGETYAQALRRDDGSYVVEHREGDADHHYATVVAHMRTNSHDAEQSQQASSQRGRAAWLVYAQRRPIQSDGPC